MSSDKKSMTLYALGFIKDNRSDISKTTQCQMWCKIAIDCLRDLNQSGEVIQLSSEISDLDHWFLERSACSQSDDILDKIKRVHSLAENVFLD